MLVSCFLRLQRAGIEIYIAEFDSGSNSRVLDGDERSQISIDVALKAEKDENSRLSFEESR